MVGQKYSGESRTNSRNPIHTAGYTQSDYMAPPQIRATAPDTEDAVEEITGEKTDVLEPGGPGSR